MDSKNNIAVIYGSYSYFTDNSDIMNFALNALDFKTDFTLNVVINSFKLVTNNIGLVTEHSIQRLDELSKLKESNCILVVVPIAYNTMHGAMKLFFDSLPFDFLKNKHVMVVATAGSVRSHSASQDNLFSIFNAMNVKLFNKFSYFSKDYDKELFFKRLANNIVEFADNR